MIGQRVTPNIQVSIGRELRLYQAYVTTAPANLDAPATFTLYTGPLSIVSGMAADSITFDAVSSKAPARLVLRTGRRGRNRMPTGEVSRRQAPVQSR